MSSSYKPHKVRLILYNQGRILLLKQTNRHGGNYTLVGGTIETNESATESIIRESKEEAGIILRKEDLELAHVLHKHRSTENRITLYFRATQYQGQLWSREPKKFKSVAWFDLEDLPENLSNTTRHVLSAYKEDKLYSEIKKRSNSKSTSSRNTRK